MTIKNKKITSKTTNKSVIITAILVIGISLTTFQIYSISAILSDDGTIDYASPFTPVNKQRAGIPFLVAYPLAITPDKYHQIDVSNIWLGRVIEKGETNITEDEVKDFFTITSDHNSIFGITVDSKTKYYQIDYVEIPLSLDGPNIKAYRLEVAPDNYIPIDMKNHSWLKNVVDNEFKWMKTDGPSATALKQLSGNRNFNFQITFDDGHKEFYNIRYVGPELNTFGGQ